MSVNGDCAASGVYLYVVALVLRLVHMEQVRSEERRLATGDKRRMVNNGVYTLNLKDKCL